MEKTLAHEEKWRGLNIKIYYDESAESPREWDNLGTMMCLHGRYALGDKHEFKTADQFREFMRSNPKAIFIPLYLYDHSGITMRTHPFSCPWDSGQVGYIYILPEKIREEYGVKRITKALRKKVKEILEGEVKTYDKYLTGEVYGFVLEDKAGEHIDSCWGYYSIDEAIAEAKNSYDPSQEELFDLDEEGNAINAE